MGDDEPQVSQYEQVWEDVQSLLRASMDNLEGKWVEMTRQMQQMEDKLASIQTQISKHSESPSSSDSSSATSSRTRKRRTPVSLQVCHPIPPCLFAVSLFVCFRIL